MEAIFFSQKLLSLDVENSYIDKGDFILNYRFNSLEGVGYADENFQNNLDFALSQVNEENTPLFILGDVESHDAEILELEKMFLEDKSLATISHKDLCLAVIGDSSALEKINDVLNNLKSKK